MAPAPPLPPKKWTKVAEAPASKKTRSAFQYRLPKVKKILRPQLKTKRAQVYGSDHVRRHWFQGWQARHQLVGQPQKRHLVSADKSGKGAKTNTREPDKSGVSAKVQSYQLNRSEYKTRVTQQTCTYFCPAAKNRESQQCQSKERLRKKSNDRARQAAAPNLISELQGKRAVTTPQEAQIFSKHTYR